MTNPPAKFFYMMRHGETVANREGYAAGSFDTPLTESGRKQALAARGVVETLRPSPAIIVHSNLSRAKDTAKIVNETFRLPMLERDAIAEQCFGDWMGQPWSHIHDRIVAGETPPNGESMAMLTARVMAGLDEILALPKEPILIVAHGGTFDALLWFFGCRINDVKNCHLYGFTPIAAATGFPWEIWHHEASEDGTPMRSRVTVSPL